MCPPSDVDREIRNVADVFAAGRARAATGGREVVLPGGMGIALIEQLEGEIVVEDARRSHGDDPPPEPRRSELGDLTARIDAARERLRSKIDQPPD